MTPRQVYVVDEPGRPLLVSVRDWQTGRESPDVEHSTATRQPTVLQGTRHFIALADQDTWVYLAPEAGMEDPDGIALDVYGLGALGYLLLTSAPPANSIAELEERIRGSAGLDPGVEIDGMTDGFRRLVMRATHPDARLERTPGTSDFLHDLDTAIAQWKSDAGPVVVVDPLEADTLDVLTDHLIVEARLGSGSTGVALLVSNTNPDATLASEAVSVLKVAHDASKAPRLQDEWEALEALDSPRIVRALRAPFDINGRRCIQLEDAGRPTLGAHPRRRTPHHRPARADWATILDADRDAPGTRDRALLDSFVKAPLDRRLPAILTGPQSLLVTDASILGGYGQQQ